MLTVEITDPPGHGSLRTGSPKVFAVYSFRHDAHLVPAMRANLAGVVSGFVSYDDRASTEVFSSEPARRRALLTAAREAGADWILAVDPDERFEPALRERIGELVAARQTVWSFAIREMFTPTAYRSDGLWGLKNRARLFPAAAVAEASSLPLHGKWYDAECGLKDRDSGLNIYHLKMLTPERRRARSALYATLDPDREFNQAGYDYLCDERGLELTEVPTERLFDPPHVEDSGLWMPDLKPAKADPVEIVLKRARAWLGSGDSEGARALIEELAEDGGRRLEGDGALRNEAADLAVHSGAPDLARRLIPDDQQDFALSLRLFETDAGGCEALELRAKGADLRRRFGDRPELDLFALRHDPRPGEAVETDVFAALGWAKTETRIRWGNKAAYGADLATVAIGLHAPAELRDAVQSLLDQSEPTLIVVFNSGRGDLGTLLGEMADRVVLVETPERVYVGAARNIGASLVRSRYVAFLAGDCLAEPGWVKERLKRHRAGMRAVASAVTNFAEDSHVGWAHHLMLFARRMPDAPEDHRLNYGLSYDRDLFFGLGWFDPSLRIGEDSEFNALLKNSGTQIVFAHEVRTAHRSETTLGGALKDAFRRGRRSRQPIFGGLRLRRINYKIPGTLVRLVLTRPIHRARSTVRSRRGLVWSGNEAELQKGLKLLPLLILANNVGRSFGAGRELALRRKAFRLLRSEEPVSEDRLEGISVELGNAVSSQLRVALRKAGPVAG